MARPSYRARAARCGAGFTASPCTANAKQRDGFLHPLAPAFGTDEGVVFRRRAHEQLELIATLGAAVFIDRHNLTSKIQYWGTVYHKNRGRQAARPYQVCVIFLRAVERGHPAARCGPQGAGRKMRAARCGRGRPRFQAKRAIRRKKVTDNRPYLVLVEANCRLRWLVV